MPDRYNTGERLYRNCERLPDDELSLEYMLYRGRRFRGRERIYGDRERLHRDGERLCASLSDLFFDSPLGRWSGLPERRGCRVKVGWTSFRVSCRPLVCVINDSNGTSCG